MEESAGERLAIARQALGLSLEDIAARTRIRRDFLDAIEAMDMRDLPERPYVAGFVRAFAGEVGLDADEIVEQFSSETAPQRLHTPKPLRSFVFPMQAARMMLVIAGAAGLTFGIVWVGMSPQQPDTLHDIPPVPEALHAWVAAQPGSAEGERAFAALTLAEAPRLTLRARIPTFLEVRDPTGRRLYSGELRRGATYTLPALPGVTVSAGNGGGVEIMSGSQSMGLLGRPGVPVSAWSAETLRNETLAAFEASND